MCLAYTLTLVTFFNRGTKVVLFRGDRAANEKASGMVMLPRWVVRAGDRFWEFVLGANIHRKLSTANLIGEVVGVRPWILRWFV